MTIREIIRRSTVFAVIFCFFPILVFAEPTVPRMIRVEGGTYFQGSLEAQYAVTEYVHTATLSSFLIAETEVTQALWAEVMGSNPSKFRGVDRPVEYVSWLDAVRFCNALSERDGFEPVYTLSGSNVSWNRDANGYRLPTEAEWEYAARGGSSGASSTEPLKKTYYAGGSNADDVAWYDRNSSKTTHTVATKAPNELGLYDMSGNVWEWCWDWYADYPKENVVDPTGPEKATGHRVLRGGAWFTNFNLIRVTYRYWSATTFKVNSVGFRIARNVTEAAPSLPSSEAPVSFVSPKLTETDFSLSLSDGMSLDLFEVLAAPKSEIPR